MIRSGHNPQAGSRRRSLDRFARWIAWAFFMALPLAAQAPETQFPSMDAGQPSRIGRSRTGPAMEGTIDMAMRRIRMLNEARQKSIVSDTEKLLRLAAALNAEAANEDQSLVPDRMRKLAEIEKLARDVKQKMSFAIQGPPSAAPEPFGAWPQ